MKIRWSSVVGWWCMSVYGLSAEASALTNQFVSYPHAVLESPLLGAAYYLPDPINGYYRGTRFDWSGMVSRVMAGGHAYFAEFRRTHDPFNHDDVCGTAEEFNISRPPGFETAKPGETFLKVGVGTLEKGTDAEYGFAKPYRIVDGGRWTVREVGSAVTFRHVLEPKNGYGYDYEKTLKLGTDKKVLSITRALLNTGTREIPVEHYGHNFIQIDDAPVGENYALILPFAPRLAQNSRDQGCLAIDGKTVAFTREVPKGKAVWVRFEGFSEETENTVRVMNRKTGALMTIKTDLPLTRLVLYSSDGVLCPEAFVSFSLQPGQTRRWTTTYEFRTVNF